MHQRSLEKLIQIAETYTEEYPLTGAEILGVLVPLRAQLDCLYDSAEVVLKEMQKPSTQETA